MALAERRRADQNCRGWLGMADNYIRAELPDKARPYLRKIIETYPQSESDAKARQRLEGIGAAK